MMTSWYSQLDRAKSTSDVLAVTRDFLATWAPDELKLLPPECRPGRVRDEEDVEALHSTLVEAYRVSRASGRELEALQRLTSFVVRASIRLSELNGSGSGGGTNAAPGDATGKSLAPPEN
jgi:hypothetical protein